MGAPGIKRKHWLQFNKLYKPPSKKTDSFEVVNYVYGETVGMIYWHSPFRKYAFFPNNGFVFDANCLQDITDKLRQLMEERQNKKCL